MPKFEETLAVIRESPPDRIGHGTFLHRYESGQGYEEIENLVLTKRIPIGKCMCQYSFKIKKKGKKISYNS